MNDNDFTWFFIVMTLFNSSLGISNVTKNEEQENRQIRIESKLDRLLELMDNESKQ